MRMIKGTQLLLATMFFLQAQVGLACVWVAVGESFLECRSPYREFFGAHPERRRQVLNIAFKNAQRRLHQILNENEILSILAESDDLYKAGNTAAVDRLIAEADKILALTNEITHTGDRFVRRQLGQEFWDPERFDARPSAFLIGVTVPAKRGLQLPFAKALEKWGKSFPHLEVGGGSIFFAAVLVPQIVEYVAEHRPFGDYKGVPGGETVYEDEEYGFRIYDVSRSGGNRLRLDDINIQAFPTVDIRATTKEEGLPRKESGLQPTLAFAWGQSIYRPEHVGTWGLSYSLPTAISRVPWGQLPLSTTSMYQNSVLGRFLITRYLTWAFLRLLDQAQIDTAKISWNSSQSMPADFSNLADGVKDLPFDQLIINIRWGDLRNRRLVREETPVESMARARVGINFGLDFFSSLGGTSSSLWALFQEAISPQAKVVAPPPTTRGAPATGGAGSSPAAPGAPAPALPLPPPGSPPVVPSPVPATPNTRAEEAALRRLEEIEGRMFQRALHAALQSESENLGFVPSALTEEQIESLRLEVGGQRPPAP